MQLTAGQTSLEPLLTGRARGPQAVHEPEQPRGWRQPVHERSLGAHYPRIPDPQAPKVDLNKLPIPARRRTAGREVAKLGQGQGPFSRWGALSSGLWALRTLHSGPVISANRTVVGSRHARFLMQRDRALAFKPECHF